MEKMLFYVEIWTWDMCMCMLFSFIYLKNEQAYVEFLEATYSNEKIKKLVVLTSTDVYILSIIFKALSGPSQPAYV